MTTRRRFMVLGFLAGTVLIAIGVYAAVMDHQRMRQDAVAAPETLIPHAYLAPPVARCGFRRSRPGIPNVFRAPFQSDGAHQSNLMAPRVVSSRRPVAVIS
jgi:hypothetical protein